MAKYIDIDKVVQKMQQVVDEHKNDSDYANSIAVYAYETIIAALKKEPAADVQEVTRCKDCVFATYIHDNQTNEITIFRCERTSKLLDDENSFCSWAIKKKAQRKDGYKDV